MAPIKFTHQCPTLRASDEKLRDMRKERHGRPYLGMSAIGEPCERKLWYGFRWAAPNEFEPKTLKAFEDGHRTEDLIISRLKETTDLEVHDRDGDGNQFGFSDIGGHFKGHMDFVCRGLIQAPKAWHVGEVKASAKVDDLLKEIDKLGEKNAIEAWNYTYYTQAQCYMGYSGLTRHWLICTSPGGRDPQVGVRTNFDEEVFIRTKVKAERIIYHHKPLARAFPSGSFYKCKWCEFSGICWDGEDMAENCRTCVNSTPGPEGGKWLCKLTNEALSIQEQEVGCAQYSPIDGAAS